MAVAAIGVCACGRFGLGDECRAESLSRYCATHDCPSYEAAESAARQHGSTAEDPCFARLGRCGELRFTYVGHAFGGTKLFFDDSGRLVAVEEVSDAVGSDACPGSTFHGFVPGCQEAAVEDLCPS